MVAQKKKNIDENKDKNKYIQIVSNRYYDKNSYNKFQEIIFFNKLNNINTHNERDDEKYNLRLITKKIKKEISFSSLYWL